MYIHTWVLCMHCCKKDVWVCESTVASRKIFVIEPLIISPSSYMATHSACAIYHPLSNSCPVCDLSSLHQYHLPATGPSLAQEGNGLEREGIGQNREINMAKCTQLYVGHSEGGLEDQHLWFPLKAEDMDYLWTGEGLSFFPSVSPTLSELPQWYGSFIPSVYLKDLYPSPPIAPSSCLAHSWWFIRSPG